MSSCLVQAQLLRSADAKFIQCWPHCFNDVTVNGCIACSFVLHCFQDTNGHSYVVHTPRSLQHGHHYLGLRDEVMTVQLIHSSLQGPGVELWVVEVRFPP